MVKSPVRTLVLLVDDVLGVFDSTNCPVTRPDDVLPDMSLLSGVAATRDGMVLIHDIDALTRPLREVLRQAEAAS